MRYLVAISLFSVISLLNTSTFAQSKRDDLLRQIQKNRSELQELEERFLAPSEEDFAAYAEFLHQPQTGLIRLLPREVYDDYAVRQNGKKSLTVRGGGAYYSFSRKTHEYGYGSDMVNGALYQSRLPLELDTTYALRSINYSSADVLVAIRTVRKDTDGSVANFLELAPCSYFTESLRTVKRKTLTCPTK